VAVGAPDLHEAPTLEIQEEVVQEAEGEADEPHQAGAGERTPAVERLQDEVADEALGKPCFLQGAGDRGSRRFLLTVLVIRRVRRQLRAEAGGSVAVALILIHLTSVHVNWSPSWIPVDSMVPAGSSRAYRAARWVRDRAQGWSSP
jgi:hypothetical protein